MDRSAPDGQEIFTLFLRSLRFKLPSEWRKLMHSSTYRAKVVSFAANLLVESTLPCRAMGGIHLTYPVGFPKRIKERIAIEDERAEVECLLNAVPTRFKGRRIRGV
jgi:hypothetical protein